MVSRFSTMKACPFLLLFILLSNGRLICSLLCGFAKMIFLHHMDINYMCILLLVFILFAELLNTKMIRQVLKRNIIFLILHTSFKVFPWCQKFINYRGHDNGFIHMHVMQFIIIKNILYLIQLFYNWSIINHFIIIKSTNKELLSGWCWDNGA